MWFLTIVGAAGAGAVYALEASPALGERSKNAIGIFAAALVSLALWLGGLATGWIFAEAWCASLLLLWASAYEVGADDLIWVRAATSTGLVVLLSCFFA